MPLLLQSPSFELWWEPQRGTFRLQSPGRALEGVWGVEVLHQGRLVVLTTEMLVQGRVVQATVEDPQGAADEVQICYPESHGIALSLRLRLYSTRPFALCQVALTSMAHETLHVRRFFFRTLPGGFHAIESPTGAYLNGWQSWAHAGFLPAHRKGVTYGFPLKTLQGPMTQNAGIPWPSRPGRFWSETVGALVTPREALVVGGASLADQFVQVHMDLTPAHLGVMVQSQGDDVPLEPGEARSSEWFYFEWVPLPHTDPLAQYAYAVARLMALPPMRPAPMGWCSWYIFWNKVAEDDMIKNLATAALLADEMPLQVIQLDEGYQTIWGDWGERNPRFPHDLKWLADRVKGSGFVPGLWLGPLTAHPKSNLARAHPDWLLRDARGRPASPGLISGAIMRALDPTHPGVEAHLHKLIETAVHEWGFSYLKLDFMYAGALGGGRYNQRMTRAQAMRNAFRIIREAAGPETYLVGCGAPLGPALGLVDAMRIGPDTAPEWSPNVYGTRRLFPNNPSLPSLRNSLRNVATRAWIHGRWWVNDPDTLMVRQTQTQLTYDEVLAQATLLGLSGGLLVISDDLEQIPLERRELMNALLPPLLDGMDVLDLFQHEMPEEVLVPVARPWGRWRLVGLFNWSAQPREVSLPAGLGLDSRKAYHVVDFWARRYLRLEPDGVSPVFHLPPHGCVLLGIRSIKPAPQLVGTTYHISQGAEVTDWQVQGNALTVGLNIGRVALGEVWLALPARPEAVTLDDAPLAPEAVRAVASGIWAVRAYLNRTGILSLRWTPHS